MEGVEIPFLSKNGVEIKSPKGKGIKIWIYIYIF